MDLKKKVQYFSVNPFFGWISIFFNKKYQFVWTFIKIWIIGQKKCWKTLDFFFNLCTLFWHVLGCFSVSNQNHKKRSKHKLARYHSFHKNQKNKNTIQGQVTFLGKPKKYIKNLKCIYIAIFNFFDIYTIFNIIYQYSVEISTLLTISTK